MNQKMQQTVLTAFYAYHLQLKTYHFQTKNYNKHYNIDGYITKVAELYDQIIEMCFGKHGVPVLEEINIKIVPVNDDNILQIVEKFIELVKNLRNIYKDDSYILNILDELEGLTYQTIYKLRLT